MHAGERVHRDEHVGGGHGEEVDDPVDDARDLPRVEEGAGEERDDDDGEEDAAGREEAVGGDVEADADEDEDHDEGVDDRQGEGEGELRGQRRGAAWNGGRVGLCDVIT